MLTINSLFEIIKNSSNLEIIYKKKTKFCNIDSNTKLFNSNLAIDLQ